MGTAMLLKAASKINPLIVLEALPAKVQVKAAVCALGVRLVREVKRFAGTVAGHCVVQRTRLPSLG
jgi:hypothetical protein